MLKLLKSGLLLLVSLSLLSCSKDNDNAQISAQLGSEPTISVIDYNGDTVSLKHKAKRIIALAPHIVENIYTAGAGAQLIATVAHSNYPEDASALPIVGGYNSLNLEKIIELAPDLVIAWGSGNSRSSVNRIKELGYPVYVDEPNSLSDIAKSISDIATLTGQKTTTQLMEKFLEDLNQVSKEYAKKTKVTTFYQVWNKPLTTISGQHIISDAIRICGGLNIYAQESAIAPVINIESLLERNPKVIIASGASDTRPQWLDEWYDWPSLQAVKSNNLFYVNPNHIQRHTVRVLIGIDKICQQLDLARERVKK